MVNRIACFITCFIAIVLANETLSAQETTQKVSDQFRRMDRDTDQKLTKEEFPGPLFDRLDTDNDGVITAEQDQAFVTEDDAPFLLIHGKNDNVIPFNQSELLAEALTKVGVEAELLPVAGGGHGNFNSPEVPKRIQAFFDKHPQGN